ncbi:Crp/Fnr family transcriptional regulator [Pseudothauera nasutitermitis]|uniref:Crp/Fnr family transcriptional regulator n=1 Tax=Pseudothauera nasutitermitis TaxID=2565930 RepID=A0A4S4AR80_9RHOO|nr:Crp/Fnr family transcriptional regulator [Pseudothauera nasutitermitis]THF62311.1 Crp/Fnr family transcriptional regulator [Pseudothauera nasutitermitis]
MAESDAWHARVAGGRWFSRISPELQGFLLGAARTRRLAAGQRLFARGDPADGLYCVVDGALRVSGIAESGKEALLVYLEPPNWFGEIALFDGGPRTHDAWAVDACTLLHVPRAALQGLLDEHPRHWRELALLLADKLRLTFVALEALALMPAPQRVRQRLAMIADGYGEGRPGTLIRIPQEELAQMVALSRQTTNQILKELAAQGAVRLHRGGIEVLDPAALRA